MQPKASSIRPASFKTKNSETMKKKKAESKSGYDVMIEWCQHTSLHGIDDLYTQPSVSATKTDHDYRIGYETFTASYQNYLLFWVVGKFCWSLILALFAAAAGMQIYQLANAFQTKPFFISSLTLDMDQTQPFPNVTICNINRVKKSKMIEYNLTKDFVEFLYGSMLGFSAQLSYLSLASSALLNKDVMSPERFDLIFSSIYASKQEWDYQYEFGELPLDNITATLIELGYGCEELLMECSIMGIRFNCCTYAERVINSERGVCWRIQPRNKILGAGKNFEQRLPGPTFGFRITINPAVFEYPDDVTLNTPLDEGVILSVDPDVNRMVFTSSVPMAPGSWNRVALQRRLADYNWESLTVRQPDCVTDGTLNILDAEYDQINCAFDQMQNLTLDKLGCVWFAAVKPDYESVICNGTAFVTEDKRVLEEVLVPLLTASLGLNSAIKASDCKPPCSLNVHVNVEVDSTDYPRSVMAPAILDQIANFGMIKDGLPLDERIIEQLIVAELYYKTLETWKIDTTEKLPLTQLIGNTGGLLGLWLGASLITLVQLLFYVCWSCSACCCSFCR